MYLKLSSSQFYTTAVTLPIKKKEVRFQVMGLVLHTCFLSSTCENELYVKTEKQCFLAEKQCAALGTFCNIS